MATIDYSQVIIRLIRADLRNVHIVKMLSLVYTNLITGLIFTKMYLSLCSSTPMKTMRN